MLPHHSQGCQVAVVFRLNLLKIHLQVLTREFEVNKFFIVHVIVYSRVIVAALLTIAFLVNMISEITWGIKCKTHLFRMTSWRLCLLLFSWIFMFALLGLNQTTFILWLNCHIEDNLVFLEDKLMEQRWAKHNEYIVVHCNSPEILAIYSCSFCAQVSKRSVPSCTHSHQHLPQVLNLWPQLQLRWWGRRWECHGCWRCRWRLSRYLWRSPSCSTCAL